MNDNIKTIIFDLGGVLLDLDRQACVKAFQKIGVHDIEQYLGLYVQQGFFLFMEEGKISNEEFCDEVRKIASDKNITNQQIYDAWCKFVVDVPDYKLDILLKLREKFQVLMLSNTNRVISDYYTKYIFTKQGLNIDDYFDKCYLSYQMGHVKPSLEIFQMLIDDFGINPIESLFLDDGEQNIIVAKQLGFHTYWVQPHEDFRHIFKEMSY